LPAPLSAPVAPAPTAYATAYRPATHVDVVASKSLIEVAAVAVPASTLRGNDRRDRVIAAIAVAATLLLCLTVVTWRLLRSKGDDPPVDSGELAGAATPATSITPGDDEPLPIDPPPAGTDAPAPQDRATPAPRSNTAPAPRGNVAPAPPGNVAPAPPAPPSIRLPTISVAPPPPPPPGNGHGKKNKKH
jgi:hypothetical protein